MAETIGQQIRGRFPAAVSGEESFRGDQTITVKREQALDVLRFLRDEPSLRFDLLMDLFAIDRKELKLEPRFALNYQLYSTAYNRWLRLRTPLPWDPAMEEMPWADSVTSIFPTANFHERETYDLMGINFRGHPWLRRIMMPDDWAGHPLRKDYPLGGEPVPFSHDKSNPQFASHGKQIMVGASYPTELPPGMDPEEYLVVNIGPHHPATHGVLRVAVMLDGERIKRAEPDIGYLHSGFEKIAENRRYEQFIPYTDRADYASAINNNLAYCLAVEKLLDVEIPPRAQYIRVILAELQRIASHLLWLGTHVLDLSGTIHGLLMYTLGQRERILDILEMYAGARLTVTGLRVGGLPSDIPPAFPDAVRHFLQTFRIALKEFDEMMTRNPIFQKRTRDIGHLSASEAIAFGVTGPLLRAAGIPLDLRKMQPYSSYQDFEFDIPTSDLCDTFGRYMVRMEEMRQSCRIVEQALNRLPDGYYRTADRKVALPPREEISDSMESLIHHFKLVTEGYKPPVGEVYHAAENPKGILGFYLCSDGSARPYRLRFRGPSFVNLQATNTMARGHLLADLIAVVGSLDIILGEVDR